MCSVVYIIVCPFVLFLLAIVLSVLRFTDSDYLPLVFSDSSSYAYFYIVSKEKEIN